MIMGDQPFVTINEWHRTDGHSVSSGDSAVRRDHRKARPQARSHLINSSQYGSSTDDERTPSATHDISRVNYHVKHLPDFAKTLEDVRSSFSLHQLSLLIPELTRLPLIVGYASLPQPGKLSEIQESSCPSSSLDMR